MFLSAFEERSWLSAPRKSNFWVAQLGPKGRAERYNPHPLPCLTQALDLTRTRSSHRSVLVEWRPGAVRSIAIGLAKMGQQRQSVEKVFGDALEMEPEARRAFLD